MFVTKFLPIEFEGTLYNSVMTRPSNDIIYSLYLKKIDPQNWPTKYMKALNPCVGKLGSDKKIQSENRKASE
jgi:hypothetical protein